MCRGDQPLSVAQSGALQEDGEILFDLAQTGRVALGALDKGAGGIEKLRRALFVFLGGDGVAQGDKINVSPFVQGGVEIGRKPAMIGVDEVGRTRLADNAGDGFRRREEGDKQRLFNGTLIGDDVGLFCSQAVECIGHWGCLPSSFALSVCKSMRT